MQRLSLLVILGAASVVHAGEDWFRRVGQVEEFSREVRRGEELILRGFTRGGYKQAELIVIAPNGHTFLNRKNNVREFNFTFIVEFDDGVGPYRMAIIAHAPNSTRSLGRFTVWHGKRRPRVDTGPPPAEGPPTPGHFHPRLLEKRWLSRLNEFRATLKLKPVGWNEAVSARCREHADRMAKARRKIHKFPPYGGVLDMLKRNGAGEGGLSGSAMPWFKVTTRRPFPLPAPQPPGPRVWNRVVTFVQADSPKRPRDPVSMERLFVESYEREAAARLMAVDPNLLEVGVGIARPKRDKWRADSLYYSIAFVQLNERPLIDGQHRVYAGLLRAARKQDPKLLRVIGRWGRGGKAARLLRQAFRNPDPAASSAAFDGMLLLDEAKARKLFAKAVKPAAGALERKDYAAAQRAWRPFLKVAYDTRIRDRARAIERTALDGATDELARITALAQPERTRRLNDLLKRVRGLAVEANVRAALGQ